MPYDTDHAHSITFHDDVIKWKHFPRYWPFVRGIHRWPVNSPHKGQWRGALMFSLICTRINGWVNNGEAGGLRRYRAHCDVTVMQRSICLFTAPSAHPACYQAASRLDLFRDMLLMSLIYCKSWKPPKICTGISTPLSNSSRAMKKVHCNGHVVAAIFFLKGIYWPPSETFSTGSSLFFPLRAVLCLTHPHPHPWTKWPPFRRLHFQMFFREWKVLYFDWNFTNICSEGSNWQ